MRGPETNHPTPAWSRTLYQIFRYMVSWLIRITVVPESIRGDRQYFYILPTRSIIDLLVLDLASQQINLSNPWEPVTSTSETKRIAFLNRGAGVRRKQTMYTYSQRLVRLQEQSLDNPALDVDLIPVSIYWGRVANKDRSLIRSFFSEDWGVSFGLRRLLCLFFNRSDVLVRFASPIAMAEIVDRERSGNWNIRKTARLLRMRFRNDRIATLGPDLPHRRTLIHDVLQSPKVRESIKDSNGRVIANEKKAYRDAMRMASNLSYISMRAMQKILKVFWFKAFDGLHVERFGPVREVAASHTLVYAPNHRSHIDYLSLSYVLFHEGLMIPHIAAGENLNMPVVGSLLRRCGAFFIKRSYRNNPIYKSVLAEYLYQLFNQGHSVEFFIEGTRSRSGIMTSPRLGFVQMIIDGIRRGLRRPIAIVPVYISYEKLIEAQSLKNELKGIPKRQERLWDVMKTPQLIRQKFGSVILRFGDPIDVATFLEETTDTHQQTSILANRIVHSINAAAVLNPVNLVALVMHGTKNRQKNADVLKVQIEFIRLLIRISNGDHHYSISNLPIDDLIQHVKDFGILHRVSNEGRIFYELDKKHLSSISMLRNNILHTIAVPALFARIVTCSDTPVVADSIVRLAQFMIIPHIERTLLFQANMETNQLWLERFESIGLLSIDKDGYVTVRTQQHTNDCLDLLSILITPLLEKIYATACILLSAEDETIGHVDDVSVEAQLVANDCNFEGSDHFDVSMFRRTVHSLCTNAQSKDDSHIPGAEILPNLADLIEYCTPLVDANFRTAVERSLAKHQQR